MSEQQTVIVLVIRNDAHNDTLTVSLNERVIGTALEDAPGVWIAQPPIAICPRHPSLTAAVEWLLAQALLSKETTDG